jgi:transcriptional regulator with XRE-family HTH domain
MYSSPHGWRIVNNYRTEYRHFLERLKTARKGAGLTQSEVARRLGKPQSFVAKCESGERRVDVIELTTLAIIYCKPVTFFVGHHSDQDRI